MNPANFPDSRLLFLPNILLYIMDVLGLIKKAGGERYEYFWNIAKNNLLHPLEQLNYLIITWREN